MPASARALAALCTLSAPFVPQLFMGEEYGENAPFQFFSNHIDEEIAVATREGRRREFASFASFDEEVPDPEDPATFEHSKLTRERNEELASLYERLIALRREFGVGEAADLAHDEVERWLRFRRGPFEVICNFSADWRRLSCSGRAIELATDGGALLSDGSLKLPPMSGAMIR